MKVDQLYVNDCIEFMQEMPKESVDLTVTSPPYDNMRDYKGFEFDYQQTIYQLYQVTKPGGVVVWVVADQTRQGNETGTSFRHALYFKEVGFNLYDTMIYAKSASGAFGNAKAYWGSFEYMFVCSKGFPKTIHLIKDRENTYYRERNLTKHRQKDGTLKRQEYGKSSQLGRRTNIWHYETGKYLSTKDNIAFKHPATFPDKLAYDHIRSWSNEGDLVFDPMCGSGTTCKMAKIQNRRYIGVDLSEEYISIAQQRLDALLL